MSTTYNSRPVFDWSIDWSFEPQSSFEVDLREVEVGFGVAALYTDQDAVIRGWEFTVWADSEAEIAALEDFFDDLGGRLVGFWLPTPEAAFRIVDGISATQFKIEDQGFADWWADHPGAFVWFTKDGETSIGAEITAVADNGDGTETITTSESITVDETWRAAWLAYVRLADDVETTTAQGEGTQRRSVSVIELPAEYAALETGSQPVWLYHFWTEVGTQTDWYFTGHAWDLDAILSIDWVAKRISHSTWRRTTRGRAELTIEADRIEPLSWLLPSTIGQPLFVEVKKADWSNLAVQTTIFTGRCVSASGSGRRLAVKCSAFEGARTKVPAYLFSTRCQYRVYEAATCAAVRGTYEAACVLDSFNDSLRQAVISGAALTGMAADYLATGWIETGANETFERRTILHNTAEAGSGTVTLTLNKPLSNASATDAAVVVPGCDGLATTCSSKFSNLVNFGGHRFAWRNLALQAIEVEATSGGKK